MMKILTALSLLLVASLMASRAQAAAPSCQAQSGAQQTPVIELYTSEGCSSCPPADRWLSSLKANALKGQAVVQAFHVAYWDYIGWVDRFADPAHTVRQRQLAARNRLSGIYTPQVVRDGQDWRQWHAATAVQALRGANEASASIALRQTAPDRFEATVLPVNAAAGRWSAYWTVTEHGHSSRVSAGENNGEWLRHDFVVRQYTPVGDYRGSATLPLRVGPADPQHPRQINLVVYDAVTGQPLQALSLNCPAT